MKKRLFTLCIVVLGAFLRLGAQTYTPFPYQTVPVVFPNEQSEAAWYALHFWDGYDFSGHYQYSEEEFREAFVEYIQAVKSVPLDVALEAIDEMMTLAAATEDSYWEQLEEAEMILYDPQSPHRNDLLWEAVMLHAVGPESPLDEMSKIRYYSMLKIVSRNQIGNKATDFVYTLPNGHKGTLHNLKADFTLLFFYNPGCSECRSTKQTLLSSGALNLLYREGYLKVLAIYPDTDVAEWREYLSENPSWWISAYDKERRIHNEELYDLKAIPTLYLLDRQKNVILKDPTPEDLIYTLERIARGELRIEN